MPPTRRRKTAQSNTAALEALPNLGPKSAQWLKRAGITTPSALCRLGALEAYRRTLAAGASPNLNLLWALYGAVHGMDWRNIPDIERSRLIFELEGIRL